MNVPEFGDHGNSYFKIEPNVPNGSNPRGRGRGGFHARGGRRPAPTKHNPGFFHDDRCDKTKDEKGEEGAPVDGKSDATPPKKAPPRSYPRKPYPAAAKNENDKVRILRIHRSLPDRIMNPLDMSEGPKVRNRVCKFAVEFRGTCPATDRQKPKISHFLTFTESESNLEPKRLHQTKYEYFKFKHCWTQT